MAEPSIVLLTPLEAREHGVNINNITHRGSVVRLSDGTQRLYARVLRAWRWKSARCPRVRGQYIVAGDLVRVEVTWPGGLTRMVSLFDRSNPWGIAGVLVERSKLPTTTEGAA